MELGQSLTFIYIKDRLKERKAQTEPLKFLQQRDASWGRGLVPVIGRANRGSSHQLHAEKPMTWAPLPSLPPLPPGHLVAGEVWPKKQRIFALHTLGKLGTLNCMQSGCRNEWSSTRSILLQKTTTVWSVNDGFPETRRKPAAAGFWQVLEGVP